MRRLVAFAALSWSVVSMESPAWAQGPATLRHPISTVEVPSPSSWVLRVPLSLAPPSVGARVPLSLPPPVLMKWNDVRGYPDPRGVPPLALHLEIRVDQSFVVGGVPMVASLSAPQPARGWHAEPAADPLVWHGDLGAKLPREFYSGAAVEQRAIGGKAVFLVAGQRF